MDKAVIVKKYSTIKLVENTIKELNKNDLANKTSAGFIYQDLVLIKQLLYLEDNGTKIGYEVLDDIHILKNETNLELIQVKNSINSDTLTESSSDFWKTILKWAKIIESTDVKNITFIFYTNRPLSNRSKLFNELIRNPLDVDKIIKIIDNIYVKLNLKESQKDKKEPVNPIYQKVKSIFNLSSNNKELLFKKLNFVTNEDNIVQDIKQRIKFFGITKDKDIDTIYEQLLGIITDKRLALAKSDDEFIIDYNYFRKNLKFDRLVSLSKLEEINFDKYYNYENKYDEDFKDKIFYKQLIDINISAIKINEFARERARACSFMDELEILDSEEKIIDSKFIEEWRELHDDEYTKDIIDNNDHNNKAQSCLRNTTRNQIYYNSSFLPKSFIKGKFIDLSNKPKLGWKLDWEEKYSE